VIVVFVDTFSLWRVCPRTIPRGGTTWSFGGPEDLVGCSGPALNQREQTRSFFAFLGLGGSGSNAENGRYSQRTLATLCDVSRRKFPTEILEKARNVFRTSCKRLVSVFSRIGFDRSSGFELRAFPGPDMGGLQPRFAQWIYLVGESSFATIKIDFNAVLTVSDRPFVLDAFRAATQAGS